MYKQNWHGRACYCSKDCFIDLPVDLGTDWKYLWVLDELLFQCLLGFTSRAGVVTWNLLAGIFDFFC